MTQTLALLLDAYRELHAKKMFWIVLILTFIIMAIFAAIGTTDHTLTILWYQPFGDIPSAPLLYKMIFSNVVVGFWLTWVAALLALISTAGLFPDFLSSGSIDLFLAKPISRLRLFLTKYVAGLLFVTLQVTLFAVMSFLILGFRGGLWEPGLFWAIPLVVLFFSYLFGICVLFGVWTRSTVAALLLTLLVWFGIFVVDYVDKQIGTFGQMMVMRYDSLDDRVTRLDTQIERVQSSTASDSASRLKSLTAARDKLAQERDQSKPPEALATARTVLFTIKTFIPKTRETTGLLDRFLFKDEELKAASKHDEPDDDTATTNAADTRPTTRRPRRDRAEIATIQLSMDRNRSVWWIIGTSLLFEGVILTLAAWTFCRRDY